MKTLKQIERERNQNCGRYHEDTNSYDVIEFDEDYRGCANCGRYFPVEETNTVDLYDDGKMHELCDECYATYLEENKEEIEMINKLNKAS